MVYCSDTKLIRREESHEISATVAMDRKKKAKKGKKAKTAKAAPTPIPSVHESQMKHLRSMLSAVENHSDYVRITVFISNWKFAYVDLLMRTTDTFETVQRELEDKHGMISDFKLFKNDNGTPPQPGEEITDLKQTLGAAGFKGGVLRPDRKIALPQNATERGILHCEFEPVIKGDVLDYDKMMVIDGKLQSAIEARAKIHLAKIKQVNSFQCA